MRIHSFQDILKEYGNDIESDDLNERQEKLVTQKYSVIVEGNFFEYENAEKWIKANLNVVTINFIFYGKTGYDFGFMEYFFNTEFDSEQFKNKVPDIYTNFPDGSCSKSDGYHKYIDFNN